MNKCSIFGHKPTDVRLNPPKLRPVVAHLISCQRCNKICGAWIWMFNSWNYFKR